MCPYFRVSTIAGLTVCGPYFNEKRSVLSLCEIFKQIKELQILSWFGICMSMKNTKMSFDLISRAFEPLPLSVFCGLNWERQHQYSEKRLTLLSVLLVSN